MENENKKSVKEDLESNEVVLSTGSKVIMKESTGVDEIMVAQMLGDKVNLQGAGAQILMQANTLKCIESVDGQPLKKPDGATNFLRTYNDFLAAARLFKTKDLNRLMRKYAEMNLEADEQNPLV